MHKNNLHLWQHSHTFGQDRKRPGEKRTLMVIALTGTMMCIEIVTGLLFGSMALLADGLHMASHAAALSINVLAYVYAWRHARNRDYSLGTGKVNALGGYTSAIMLVLFALLMVWESLDRFLHPVQIVFNQAILVAVIGLAVNGFSVLILGVGEHHHGQEEHHGSHSGQRAHHHDLNLKSAYLHVIADALTSILAIIALLFAKYFGFIWMDPAMGIVGACLVTRWAFGLLRMTSGILLDKQGPESIREAITNRVQEDGDSRVADIHLWSIGPSMYALMLSIVARDPKTVNQYKARIPNNLSLAHVSIEVHTAP
ncbi:MAG: CDF family Co(II)/Ni(II) efflux transporter DmeF [Desulfohalobiaceae bacterium]|nr:CDF family Co(II)/Ni(II) efflux transporter DmeF [Desulfohalobiaceae bacterium]